METDKGGTLDNQMNMTPDDLMDIHRDGQKSGFIAGVIFCVIARHLYIRNKETVRVKRYPYS